jgi:hydrogenase-4 component E
MHLVKKNSTVVWLYVLQSAVVVFLLIMSSITELSLLLALALISTIVIKLFIAPTFFFNLIKRHQLVFSATTYLNTPLTLFCIAALVAFTESFLRQPLTLFTSVDTTLLIIAVSAIFCSFLLIVNRRGALSQMIGILSAENAIVSFALFAGLEQSPSLQLGIMFDLLIWILVATVFASMIYREYGSLDVSEMTHLTE